MVFTDKISGAPAIRTSLAEVRRNGFPAGTLAPLTPYFFEITE